MSIRAKFLGFIDVIMRIPPLFLLDEILKMNLFENITSTQLKSTIINETILNQTESIGSSIDLQGFSIALFKCIIFLIGKSRELATKSKKRIEK